MSEKKTDPGYHKGKSQYTSLRIAPSIYSEMNKLVCELQETDSRKWSVSRFVNVALSHWLKQFPQFNKTRIAELFEEYEELRAGNGNLK